METITKYASIGLIALLAIALIYISIVSNQRDNALDKLDIANKNIEQLNSYISKTKEQLEIIQKLDRENQQRLTNAQIENDKLRDDLANNVKRVYVRASCPDLPKTSSSSKLNERTAQLNQDARQDYLRLRLEIVNITNQVLGLQEYINNVCLAE